MVQLTREQKEGLVDELAEKIDEHQVVGVLDMHSLPARQLQQIKKELVGDASIQMTRKNLIHLAFDQSSKDNIDGLEDNTAVQPALIFSDQNPFTLYRTIQERKTSAPASGGEIAPNDIVVESGKTDLDPGPMLGRIQELGAQTSVEDGKIKVENDAVAVEEGEVIDDETAEILDNLGMEPLEVGLDLKIVHEDGEIFGKDVLNIDPAEYRQDIESAASGAFNLAVNADYITDRTAAPLIQQGITDAKNLGVNAGVVNEELIDDLLSKASSDAAGLDAAVDLDNVEIEEAEADEGDSGEEQEADEDDDSEDAEDEEPAEELDDESEDAADDDSDEEDAEDTDEETDTGAEPDEEDDDNDTTEQTSEEEDDDEEVN